MTRSRELSLWIDYLNRAELPVFANTARRLVAMSSDGDCSAQDLAAVILNDSAMTARVLRLANSVVCNPGGNRIDTVSYAIMLLGFDAVRNLALSIALIDTVLAGRAHDNAMHLLMLSLHAAVQARELALAAHRQNNEEVFIGAMLYRLGHIVFWCFPQGKAEALVQQQEQTGDADLAQRRVLGFTLDELTIALSEEWKLGDIVVTALIGRDDSAINAKIVRLSHALANAIAGGWHKPKLKPLCSDYAGIAAISTDKVMARLQEIAQIAIRTLQECGLRDFATVIPSLHAAPPDTAPPPEAKAPQLFLRITQELTQMICRPHELNSVLTFVLEGLYRTLPVDFVVMFLYDKRGNCWREKLALGRRPEKLDSSIVVPLGDAGGGDAGASYCWKRQHTAPLNLPVSDYFWGSIGKDQRALCAWLAVADSDVVKLGESDYLSFKQLCDLASIAFRLAQQDRRGV